jgi:hypothetical protein
MNKKEKLEKLYLFKGMDKYAVFGKAQPGIIHTNEDQQKIISDILDNCCKELAIEIESVKRPTKSSLNDIITKCMLSITNATVNIENKDFGYHLCYFLAEKTGLDIWRNSDTKIWGYWKVEDGNVKTVKRMRKSKK